MTLLAFTKQSLKQTKCLAMMKTMLPVSIVIIFLVKFVGCFQLQPKGPTHKKLAVSCIEQIARDHFHYRYSTDNLTYVLMMTIMITANMTAPAFEIQEGVVKSLNHLAHFPIEVIDDQRKEFQSYRDCLNCPTEGKKQFRSFFVEQYQSYIVVMVVESEENFDKKFELIQKLSSFNPNSLYFVYFATNVYNYKSIAYRILYKMWVKMMYYTLLLIPRTLKTFEMYRLNLDSIGQGVCNKKVKLFNVDRCEGGHLLNLTEHYYTNKMSNNFKNCTMNVITMPYVPFVINATHGLEIAVLHKLGKMFNIFFNVTLLDQVQDWGERDEYNQWTSGLGIIYNKSYIGLGNIGADAMYMQDFDFSREYFSEHLIWVVPIANQVPKWRVLTVIFTMELWAICFASIILFAALFKFSSMGKKDAPKYIEFKNALLTSFQIIITNAVGAPKTDLTRVFFLSAAIFSIIISSVYTSALMYFLKNPIRGHQIHSTEEILNSNLDIGGLSTHRLLFNISDLDDGDLETVKIFNRYKTVAEENDTAMFWLERVAKNRNTCTVSSSFYVNYLLASNNNVTNDADGRPKVFPVKKKLMAYSLSIVTKKGDPILEKINTKIKYMVAGGLVDKIAVKYIEAIKRQQHLEEHPENTVEPLTIDHLQGAFAIYILGQIFGAISWLLEMLVKKYKDVKANKKIQALAKKRNYRQNIIKKRLDDKNRTTEKPKK